MSRLWAIGIGAFLFLTACGIRLPDAPKPLPRRDPDTRHFIPGPGKVEPEILVWLISDELHTGMVFDYQWLLESGFKPPLGFGTPRYVTLSWGDRTAYVEKGLHSPWKIFKALFLPTPSVMELIPANWNVTEVCPHQRIWRKSLARDRGKDLAAFLNDCSIRDSAGHPLVCGTSSWGGGVLLESRHTYFIPRVCNIWTGQAIESLGGTIHPWDAMFANDLIRQAEMPHNGYEQIWWGSGKKTQP